MCRVKIFAVFMSVSLTAVAEAQNHESILKFIGTSSAEETDPHEVERLEGLLENPLEINLATESGLRESGLFSHYQVASMVDYRARHGDIMSLSELSAVDGFNPDSVTLLAPFISLESIRLPGREKPYIRNELSLRTGILRGESAGYGFKYRLDAGGRITGGISISRTSSSSSYRPDAFAGHFAFHFRRRSGKILIGDFNARFSQGLALWNGMGFSGLTSASSFMKKPSGISASSSFTGTYTHKGIAADIGLGRMRMSAMTAVSKNKGSFSMLPALDVSMYFGNGQASLVHYADFSVSPSATRIPDMKTSAGTAFCIRGVDLYSEAVFDWVSSELSALAGVTAPVGDNMRIAAMLRYYPSGFNSSRSSAARSGTKCSNEYAASVAADFSAGKWMKMSGSSGFVSNVRRNIGKFSADFACFPEKKPGDRGVRSLQVKTQVEWTFMVSDSFSMSARVSERIRTWGEQFRTDMRLDFSYLSEYVYIDLRMNALCCRETGLLSYLEGGYTADNLKIFLRSGLFCIDNWADRIYVYERDAPGTYNVPAYYGRGLWGALMVNWKFASWGRMYLRTALTSYPFMREKKPGRAELKIQFTFRF